MTLDGIGVHWNNLVQSVESDITSEKKNQAWFETRRTMGKNRILLSLLLRNLPSILIAITRKPVSASISRTVSTVSYKMEFPTFFDESVLVATYNDVRSMHDENAWSTKLPVRGYHSSSRLPLRRICPKVWVIARSWPEEMGLLILRRRALDCSWL